MKKTTHRTQTQHQGETAGSQQESLCRAVEKLANAKWDKFYEHRLLHLQRQWDASIATSYSSQTQRFKEAATLCATTISNHNKFTQAPQQQKELIAELESAIEARASEDCHTQERGNDMARYRTMWSSISAIRAADTALEARWEQLLELLKSYIEALERVRLAAIRIDAFITSSEHSGNTRASAAETLLTEINWPKRFVPPPQYQALRDEHNALTRHERQETRAQQQAVAQADKLISRLRGILKSKKTRPAVAVHNALIKQLGALTESQRANYRERMEHLDSRMEELLDWKAFASEPKMLSLCEAMEQLAQQPGAAREQLRAIKSLQNQWSKLGYSPAAEKHWPRFKEAADIAFKPCAELVARHQAQLEKNMHYVEESFEQLEQCIDKMDKQQVDWKTARQVLDTTNSIMERNRALPKEHRQQLRTRYKQLHKQWHEKLQPMASAHQRDKELLLERAQKLATQPVGAQQVQQACLLRDSWMQLLKVPQEKSMHAQFEQILSPLLKIANERKDQVLQKQQDTKAQITANIETVEKWLDLDDIALSKLDAEYQTLLTQTRSLLSTLQPAHAPKTDKHRPRRSTGPTHALEKRFERALHNFENHISALPKRQQDAHKDILRQYVNLCQDMEWSTAKTRAKALAALQEADAMLVQIDKKVRNKIKRRGEDAVAGTQQGDAQARRLLCVRLEILTNTATPEEDQLLRNNYLMEQMQKGMRMGGLRDEEINQQANVLHLEYLCGPVATKAVEQVLVPRVEQAMLTLRKKTKTPQRAPQATKRNTNNKQHGARRNKATKRSHDKNRTKPARA